MSETVTEINPETILQWSAPKRVTTKFGDRILRKAAPTDDFRAMFGSSKRPGPAYNQLKGAGIGWAQEKDGSWVICWWAQISKEERAQAAKTFEASRATDAAVDLPRPAGLDYMAFQKAGIVFSLNALKTRPGVLIGDEMGLGKSIQAIGLINATPEIKRVLLFCPASIKLNWHRELKKWLVRPMTVGVGHSKCIPSTDIVILNYDLAAALRRRLETVEWDLIICDEIHLLKNKNAQRSRAIFGYEPKRKELEAGTNPLPPLPAKRRVGLSGTLVVNKPAELWPILNWADPNEWPSFWKFAKRYCDMKNTGWGVTTDGATNLDELQHRLRSTCLVRRLKRDVLVDLPPKRRQVIELPANGASEVIAKEREVNEKWDVRIADLRARVELAKATEDNSQYTEAVKELGVAIKVSFEECGRAAHDVAIAKVPYLVDHVRDSADDGKIILFAHHLDVIQKYVEEFNDLHPLKITGEVKVEDRQGIVDRFQNDPKHRVIVCGIHAAGVGLTLTASSHVIFAELDWVPANMLQCEDRAHRIGQKDSVLVQHMVMEGSIDVRQANALIRKMDIIDQALDRKHAPRPEAPEYKPTAREYEPRSEAEEKAERWGGDAIRVKKEAYEREAATITKEQLAAIHTGLQILAGVCDGAAKLDGAGFSKVDANIGHSLAMQGGLTPRQGVLGRRLVTKYRRQLSPSLVEAAGGKTAPAE